MNTFFFKKIKILSSVCSPRRRHVLRTAIEYGFGMVKKKKNEKLIVENPVL